MSSDSTPQNDLVAQTFSALREHAREGGFNPPSLQKLPRKNAGWTMDAPATAAAVAGSEESEKSVARDIAGTRIPDRLLYARGIKVWRKRDRAPQSIGAVLAKQSAERGWNRNIAHGVIMTKWPEIVGSVVAEHTEVREFKDSTVVVQCSSSAWATQLRLAQTTVLHNIAEAVGDGIVDQLKIYGPQAPSWRKGRFHVKGRGPRDTYG